MIEARRNEAGYLPTVGSSAAEIVQATLTADPDPLVLAGEVAVSESGEADGEEQEGDEADPDQA